MEFVTSTDTLKVFVENLPKLSPWYIEWVPIIIALFAFVVSIMSLYWSRKQFRDSSRPFVWVESNFGYLNSNNRVANKPQVIATKVMNAQALLVDIIYKYYNCDKSKKELLHEYKDSNVIRYPSDKVQYTYTWGSFSENPINASNSLKRYVRIEYTSLSGGKKYFFECESNYDSSEKIWREEYQGAN